MLNIITSLTITFLLFYTFVAWAEKLKQKQMEKEQEQEFDTSADAILDEITTCRTEKDLFEVRTKINRYKMLNPTCQRVRTLESTHASKSRALAKYDG